MTALAVTALVAFNAAAQELTPRAYWPAPVRTNVVVTSYQLTSGDVIADPSLPVVGVESDIQYLQASYQRTFGLFGRTSVVTANVPYTQGTSQGYVDGEFMNRDIDGLADARVRFAINIRGAPVMDGAGFRSWVADPDLIVGASVLVSLPTGDYDPERLINAGANRWAVKPAFGVIWPISPNWLFEVEAGAWFYADNDEFLGVTREQDPVLSTELHLIRQTRRGNWIGLDANYYTGGETTAGGKTSGRQQNSRLGLTAFIPLRSTHAIRFSYSTGVVVETGGDYELFSVSYLYAW